MLTVSIPVLDVVAVPSDVRVSDRDTVPSETVPVTTVLTVETTNAVEVFSFVTFQTFRGVPNGETYGRTGESEKSKITDADVNV